jgi:aryl-alcohol dehydrogenase-like predicted oxidoreductase
MACRWLRGSAAQAKPVTTVIVGAKNETQLQDRIAAARLRLDYRGHHRARFRLPASVRISRLDAGLTQRDRFRMKFGLRS